MSQPDADAAVAPQTTDDAAEASQLSTESAADSPETPAAAAEDSTESADQPGEEAATAPAGDLDAWKAHARKHERRAEKAEKSVRQLQEQVANHDAEVVEHQQQVAQQMLATELARSGMPAQETATLIEHIDSMRLLSDGAPSQESITQVARSLSASTQRGEADADQGRRSELDGLSADAWIRRQARPH